MKYIRTEKKIGIAPTLAEIPSFIQQSDTIEELCDEFVCYGDLENKIFHIADTFDVAKNVMQHMGYKCCYGAIWTDKGLIYVAKMNKEGKLCLI